MSVANAIQVTLGLKYANGSLVDAVQSFTTGVTQNNQEEDAPTVTIPTTAGGTVVSFPDLTTLGWLYMRNLDSANYVTFGPTATGALVPFGRMQAGEPAVLRLEPGISLRLLANTAPVKVQFKAFGN